MNELYYIDTHVHLNDETLLKHLDEVISDARNNNVKKLFVVGWDLDSSIKSIELAHKYEEVYAIIGFHPCNIRGYSDYEYNWLEEHISDDKVVAIGEIGYDFHWDDTTREEQEYAFERQLEIAVKHHMPVSIHSRDADQATFDMLKKYHKELKGCVLHCYSGSYELAKEYIKFGFYLGVDGPITFKNNRRGVEVVTNIPLEYLITETDSPYLTPHPYRGCENSPKYIPLITNKIAELKQLSIEDVTKQIIINVNNLFGV